jgi:hypothetical protein
MGPRKCPGPVCRGRKKLAELATASLQKTWAESEGLKWEWRSHESQPTLCVWWRLCEDCHKLAWPRDRRCRGPNCKPWEHLEVRGARLSGLWLGPSSPRFFLSSPPLPLSCFLCSAFSPASSSLLPPLCFHSAASPPPTQVLHIARSEWESY